ncbi:hypothetical protein LTS14_001741 [Recurvomyces mirabilis]|uniref:uncharacterized protein n=1 Tax=Recurvomyces mirabilis TaxID=574656 RepID=UPI002DE18261|nr:hypothetical protein LTS14_001741 [Recurvomyces mirabilis]
MAPTRHYTAEQLLHLRSSPLVKKPDNLPAIEQWIDETQQSQQQTNRREPSNRLPKSTLAATAAEASPMGNFSTGQGRPGLTSRNSTARGGDGVTLGPSKALFASSRTTAKLADFDKPSTPLTENALEETEGHRNSRTFGEKQLNRKSMGADATDGRTGESWRRADNDKPDGDERNGKYGRRDREQDGDRRNGYGDRPDSRWHRDRDEKRPNGGGQGGWREREREREKDRPERGWGRGQADTKEPEWFGESATKPEDDFTSAKTAEDFEKWKQSMNAQNRQSTEITNDAPIESVAPTPIAKEAPTTKTVAPLKLEGIMGKPFGSWDSKTGSAMPDSAPVSSKPSSAKPKTSRFQAMFKAPEPAQEIFEAPANEVLPPGAPPRDAAEDKAGFDRVLQMLGGTTIGQVATPNEPASPQPRQVSNGNKPKSRFTGFFDQTPKSPERMQVPEDQPPVPFMAAPSRNMVETRGMVDEPSGLYGVRLPERQQSNEQPSRNQMPITTMSPEPPMPSNGLREQQGPPSGRVNDIFIEQPPSRGASTPDINIQNLLAARPTPRQQQADQSNFLLGLLQTKGARPPPQQQQQPRPDDNFQLWVEQQPKQMPEPHAPKPRAAPPPGSFEDQLLRNHNAMEAQRQVQQQPPPNTQDEPDIRRMSQRVPPPGFMGEQNHNLYQQPPPPHHARNFTEPPRQFQHPPPPQQQQQQHHAHNIRRMSGHPGLPQMAIPQQQPPYPAEFLQSPHAAAPPPGFNPGMPRHPPGIHNIPNIFSTPQPPPNQHQPPNQQQQREPPSQPPQLQPGFASMLPPTNGGPPNLDARLQQHATSPIGAGGPPPPGFFGGLQGYGGPPPSSLPMPQGFGGLMRGPPVGDRMAGYTEPMRAGGVGPGRVYDGYGAQGGR